MISKTIKKLSLKKKIIIFFKVLLNKDSLKSELIYPLVYSFTRKYLNHYLWSTRKHSRNYSFESNKKFKEGELINLGGGKTFFADKWLNVDFLDGFEDCERGLNGKLGLNLLNNIDNLPFQNVKQFYISHVLEHFNINDSIRLLNSCYESSEENAFIRIIVPNSDLIIDRLRENDLSYFKPLIPCFYEKDRSCINNLDLLYFILSTQKCRFMQRSNPNSSQNNTITREYNKEEYKIFDKSNDEIVELLNTHNYVQNNTGLFHMSCFNSKKLISILKKVGYRKAYQSAFNQSRSEEMRNTPMIDGSHPWMSLYVEAIK